MSEMVELPLAEITLDADLQPRVEINQQLVEDYVYAIADGRALPPVTVVFDGAKHWLADGYHRWHAHNTLGLAAISADVRNGTALDAVLISLAANAEHGKRREAGDYRKAYDIACRYDLVPPTNSDAVAKLLRCSIRWAEMLTRGAREEERALRALAIRQAQEEGKSNREIAGDLGVSPSTVDRAAAASKTKSAQMTHPAEDPDPYADARKMQSASSLRWHGVLEALRAINAQAGIANGPADRSPGRSCAWGQANRKLSCTQAVSALVMPGRPMWSCPVPCP
jgi:ParB-like chromosome segregation protein Spo0J